MFTGSILFPLRMYKLESTNDMQAMSGNKEDSSSVNFPNQIILIFIMDRKETPHDFVLNNSVYSKMICAYS